MKWTESEKALNFDYIPHIANNNYPKNFTYQPLLGNSLKAYHKNLFCKRTEKEQNNIRRST